MYSYKSQRLQGITNHIEFTPKSSGNMICAGEVGNNMVSNTTVTNANVISYKASFSLTECLPRDPHDDKLLTDCYKSHLAKVQMKAKQSNEMDRLSGWLLTLYIDTTHSGHYSP